ncbi:hypothetical protein [Photobacterium lutimaris]|uniref:EamA domain-containing protein n=1 Tax=Photobacterium lutimaris TaxID=388278 RepID=A0A2T3IY56_9GAMM|nr:hypothetical protein [Photobacterium lutimaris]PSU33521.1 hypothetical protein C9I99_12125 [Photobacterium lutimaris]TDR74646.1 hypothetical protein DFP78_107234 [Photobacterium lutimaris]
MNGLVLGYIYIFLYCILSVTKDIVLEDGLKTSNTFDYLLIVFTCVALFYIINDKIISTEKNKKTKNYFKDNIWLNIVTVGNWLGLFYSLKFFSAPVVSALYAGLIPLTTLIVNKRLRPKSKLSKGDYIATISLFLCAVFWSGYNIEKLQETSIFTGLTIILISSLSISSTTVFSKRLAENGCTAVKIMAHRFYILIFFSAIFSSPPPVVIDIFIDNLTLLAFVIGFGTILSLWLFQIGVNICEPIITHVIISTCPIISLIIYFFYNSDISIPKDTIFFSSSVVIIAIIYGIFDYYKNSQKLRN